jgi:hypothetical protein
MSPSQLFRESLLKALQEPVPPDPDEIDTTPPPSINSQRLGEIHQLPSLDEAADLMIDIDRNIDLLEGIDEVWERARKLEYLKRANGAKRCEHVKPDGVPCGSPAVSGKAYCFFHGEALAPVLDLPIIEDQHSLQVAFTRLAQQVVTGRVKATEAKVLLQILQSAANNLDVSETE